MSVRQSPLPPLSGLAIDDVARDVCRGLGIETPAMQEVATLHAHALVAASEWNAPDMLTDQFAWERTRLAGLGVTLRYRELHEAVLRALLPRVDRVTHARLRVLYEQAERLDRGRPEAPPPSVCPEVARYLEHALAGDTAGAAAMVRTALAHGATPTAVVRDLLLPAQVETGRLWESGVISVAQEHRVTGVTTRCLDLFGTAVPREGDPRPRGRVVVATVGTEGHDLGLRMLAQAFAGEGWDVDHLGARVPADDLVEHVLTTAPDVLAISATMTAQVSAVARVLTGLHEACSATRVLVGGRVFTARPALAQALGADATAADARTALALCQEWREELAAHSAAAASDPDQVRAAEEGAEEAAAAPDVLAQRYRIDPRHVDGALALLATESGLGAEELRRRLTATVPTVAVTTGCPTFVAG